MQKAKEADIKLTVKKYNVILKLVLALILAVLMSGSFVYFQYNTEHTAEFMFDQLVFISFFVFMALLFPFFGFKKVAIRMFDNRWIVMGCILLFLTIGKYHGDSFVMYDRYIQSNSGNEYISPLFGIGRGIRSDEWVVSNPSILSNEFMEDGYSESNEIMQGRDTDNAVSYANTDSILSIGSNVFTFIFGKIGVEYAFSFYWYSHIFLCFLGTIEIGMIITRRNKLVSLLGGVLLAGSSWFLWWGFPTVITFAQMAIVMGYYFIQNKKLSMKALCGLGFSIFFSCFVCCLYPAWQIPIGYIALVFVIWFIANNWKTMAGWRKEWLILLASVALSVVFIVYYFYSARDYVAAITQTVYPGERRDVGGMIIHRMFYGFMSPYYGFEQIANPTMVSIVLSFFPIPLLMLVYYVIRKKQKSPLLIGFIVVSIYLVLYCTVGLPEQLANITMISMSTTSKVVEILSILQLYILMIVLDRINEMPKVPNAIGIFIGFCYAIISAYICTNQLPDYMSNFYLVCMSLIFAAVIYVIVTKVQIKNMQLALGMIMIVTVVQALYIRPVSKGLDAIYSKPLAKKIIEICEDNKDTKWLAVTDHIFLSGYMVACGAPTVNSVNRYPNMELWSELDPEGIYEHVYNRYAHVYLELTQEDTYFELVKSDVMRVHLNYDDLKKLGITHVVSLKKLKNTEGLDIEFNRIYKKDKSYIYELNY